MTEAEKIIQAFIELLKNNSPIFLTILDKFPQMQGEFKNSSSPEDMALVIQKYCKNHEAIKTEIISKAAIISKELADRNNPDEEEDEDEKNQIGEIETIDNIFLINLTKKYQENQIKSSKNLPQNPKQNESN